MMFEYSTVGRAVTVVPLPLARTIRGPPLLVVTDRFAAAPYDAQETISAARELI